jgi:hypothetical protein
MADTSKPYDLLTMQEYTDAQGEVKTRYRNVGVAFDNDKGGQTIIVADGIALSGKLITVARKD